MKRSCGRRAPWPQKKMMTDCKYDVYGTEGHEEKTMGQWRDGGIELAAGFSTWNLVGGGSNPMAGASPFER